MIDATNHFVISLAKNIVEHGVSEVSGKQLVQDFNAIAELVGKNPVKKFASKTAGQKRLADVAAELNDEMGYMLEEPKKEGEPEPVEITVVDVDKTHCYQIIPHSPLSHELFNHVTSVIERENTHGVWVFRKNPEDEFFSTKDEMPKTVTAEEIKRWVSEGKIKVMLSDQLPGSNSGEPREYLMVSVTRDGATVTHKYNNMKVTDVRGAEKIEYNVEPTESQRNWIERSQKSHRLGRGLIINIDGTEYKYSQINADMIKDAEVIEYVTTPSEGQKSWIEAAKTGVKRTSTGGGSRNGLKFVIDGREVTWAGSKTSDFADAKEIVMVGEPTVNQATWLAKYHSKFVTEEKTEECQNNEK